MEGSALGFYTSSRDTFRLASKAQQKKIRLISLARMVSFLLIPGFYFALNPFGNLAQVVPSIASLVFFLVLVKKHVEAEKTYKKLLIKEKLASDEIEALNHRFSQFDDGAGFQDPTHPYSYDLDVFGKGSLFQYINRTSTSGGYTKLASWLMAPCSDSESIKQRQSAVAELAQKNNWRLEFLSSGKMFEETRSQHEEVLAWSQTNLPFRNARLISLMIRIVHVVTMISVLPAILYGVWFQFYLAVFSQWIILFLFRKKTKEYYRFFGQKTPLIEKYGSLIEIIGNEKFQATWLLKQQEKILFPEPATRTISQLTKLVKEFEFRQNMLAGFFLNSLLVWDVRCIYKLYRWHETNKGHLSGWLEVIEDIDALLSLAAFACNNPGYVYPEIVSDSFLFSARDLGHPLLDPKKRVNNDFTVDGWSKIVIVTGANMAGKSTFLRTVGINLVLAQNGMPVCATDFRFTPVGIFTNMRTTDSLYDDESYFFAELKRLSTILSRLENGEKIFVILDEILKGTNSIDKLNGSVKLVKRLIQLQSVALVATHDLKLSEIERNYPGNVINRCFEIKIEDNELVFDFKLKEGVTKTMNATFLMKKMGIIRNDE